MEAKPAIATLSRPIRENTWCGVLPHIYNSYARSSSANGCRAPVHLRDHGQLNFVLTESNSVRSCSNDECWWHRLVNHLTLYSALKVQD